MQEILLAIRQLFQALREIVGQAFDLSVALFYLLWTSSVSIPAPALLGLTLSALLLGLFLGRISKRGGPGAAKTSHAGDEDRIVLDLEKLRPLGLSAEEEAESEVMDISRLRRDQMTEKTEPSDPQRRQGPGPAPAR